jgi:hypothetical protein
MALALTGCCIDGKHPCFAAEKSIVSFGKTENFKILKSTLIIEMILPT